jgi:general secretion pathway protein K
MFLNIKNDGVALISALILIVIATSITTFIFKSQQLKIKEINLQRINLQASQIYEGAVDWIKLILDEDLKFSETDTLEEPWTLKLEKIDIKNFTEDISLQKEFSNAHINGYLIDAERLFNVTNLILGDSKRKNFYKKRFENLLDEFSDLEKSQIEKLLLSIENFSISSDKFNFNAQKEDLINISNIDSKNFAKIHRLVIFLPVTSKNNINTIDQLMLKNLCSIDEPNVEEIINARKESSFKNKRDLLKRVNSIQGNECLNFLKMSSNYFIVHGLVKIDKVIFNGSSLLDRTSGKTRLLWSRI